MQTAAAWHCTHKLERKCHSGRFLAGQAGIPRFSSESVSDLPERPSCSRAKPVKGPMMSVVATLQQLFRSLEVGALDHC